MTDKKKKDDKDDDGVKDAPGTRQTDTADGAEQVGDRSKFGVSDKEPPDGNAGGHEHHRDPNMGTDPTKK